MPPFHHELRKGSLSSELEGGGFCCLPRCSDVILTVGARGEEDQKHSAYKTEKSSSLWVQEYGGDYT